MGALQATEFANAVHSGVIDLQAALQWHVTANHWPPLPVEYVDILSSVVIGVNGGELDELDEVTLPGSLRIFPGQADQNEDGDFVVRVGDLLDATNCWFFVDEG